MSVDANPAGVIESSSRIIAEWTGDERGCESCWSHRIQFQVRFIIGEPSRGVPDFRFIPRNKT